MSLDWNFKACRVGVYKCFMSLSKIERKFFVFVGILEFKGDRGGLVKKPLEFCNFSVNMSRLYIAIHNWVIHVQRFKTKGGFPPPRNFSIRTHINFTRLKKNRGYVWKATHKRKSWTSLNYYVYAWPFIHCLYCIYVRSHGKITRQWKSTLTDLINREDTMVYSLRAVGRSVVRLPASWSLHRRHRRVAITDCVYNLILFGD